MTFNLRALLVGGFALAIAALSLGQTSPYRAVIANSGQVKLLSNGQQMMLLRYGLFYDGWNELRGFSEEGVQLDGSYLSRAPLYPGQMTVSTNVFVSGNSIQLTIRATPSRTITSNSSHINIRYDEMFWADSTFAAGTWNVTFPRRLDQTISSYGRSTSNFITNSPNGLNLNIGLGATYPFVLQDSRIYNCGFELRAQDSSGTWNANTTKTYVVTLTPSVPMIIGPDQPIVVVPGADWVPVDHKLNIQPGSALDWSRTNVPAAGSSGWVKADSSGQFYFENQQGVPVKFFGTNISASGIFMDPAVTDSMLDQLARMGYNAIRLHHFDGMLTAGGQANSTTLDPFYIARFHYFVEAARLRGMYITIDLLSQRITRPNEILPGSVSLMEHKLLLLANSTAKQNQLTYSLNLLNSVSPFTGRKVKDEPAIAWIDLVNETPPLCYPRGSLRSEVFDALEAASGRPWGVTTDLDARTCDLLQGQYHDWMTAQLRSNGVKALTTSMNIDERNAFSVSRSRMDFMSHNAHYLAHPEWLGTAWVPPFTQWPLPPVMNVQRYGMLAAARIYQKPYMVEEFDAVAPQPYRGEYGLVMGAVASVQKWNAVFRFGYTDRMDYLNTVVATQTFITATDPASMAAERAVKALFHRGDLTVTDAPTVIKIPAAQAGMEDNREIPLVKNGSLYTPLALSNTVGVTNPATPILDGISRRPGDTVVADFFRQSLFISTPNTCAIISNPATNLVSGRLNVTIERARASVWVTTVDGLPISSSRRMLLVHLTEIQNSGTTWSNIERSIVTSLGTLPHLARDGTAMINLTIPNASMAKVYRLDGSGRRLSTVNMTVNRTTSTIAFQAKTRSPFDGLATIYYEIVL